VLHELVIEFGLYRDKQWCAYGGDKIVLVVLAAMSGSDNDMGGYTPLLVVRWNGEVKTYVP
jgi:hypothetical protein